MQAAIKLLLRKEALFANRDLVPGEGGMVTVQQAPDQTATFLAQEGLSGVVDISGYPHPSSAILSGAASALDEVQERMSASGIDSQRRAIKYGMHATHVRPVADQLRSNENVFPEADSCEAKVKHDVVHWSNVSGTRLQSGPPLNANYWATQLTTPIHYK
ncbi:putative Acyl transferase domain superfamily, malonyl-CoA ACP transacylase, ACP-binding protein [Septoria linicola]|nr:putative Acyl transferase domain superfamily, malonyl-CoA ACP transacylase, ACP-binding protein [Septoria linicola]